MTRYLIVWLFIFATSNAHAMEWQIRPNISTSEVYDDNLNLSQTNRIGGFATELTPGMRVRGVSPWNNVSLNYRLQGLYNADADDAVNVYHQLQMRSLLQPVRNTLYLQTSAFISQQNSSNNFLATDNIAGNTNLQTQNENFSFIPYLTPHFGQYATGLLKAGYTGNYFSHVTAPPGLGVIDNPITNSQTILKQGGLNSGTFFNKGSWNIGYFSNDQRNTNGSDIRFENYTANGRLYLTRKFNMFVNTGYENNFYSTTSSNPLSNGFTYTVGGQWIPSLWYAIEAGYGNNSHVAMKFFPSENFSTSIRYNYTNVGLNLHSSWNGNLTYRTAYTTWNATYQQETTTVQQVLATQETLFVTDPVTGVQNLPRIINLPNLVNDVIIFKTGEFKFTYKLGKSSLNASIYNTRRFYQSSLEQDTVYGVNAGWNWQIIPRLTYYLRPQWQQTQSNVGAANTDIYGVITGLTRGIPINLGAPLLLNSTLEFRHMEQLSSLSGYSYVENRATANFFVQF